MHRLWCSSSKCLIVSGCNKCPLPHKKKPLRPVMLDLASQTFLSVTADVTEAWTCSLYVIWFSSLYRSQFCAVTLHYVTVSFLQFVFHISWEYKLQSCLSNTKLLDHFLTFLTEVMFWPLSVFWIVCLSAGLCKKYLNCGMHSRDFFQLCYHWERESVFWTLSSISQGIINGSWRKIWYIRGLISIN